MPSPAFETFGKTKNRERLWSEPFASGAVVDNCCKAARDVRPSSAASVSPLS